MRTDVAALAACMADTSPTLEIFLPENEGENPDGSWKLSVKPFASPPNAPLVASRGNITRSNVRIYGNGKFRTIVRQFATEDWPVFMAQVDPANTAAVLTNIQIDNLSMIGNLLSGPGPYNEQNNLIFVGGVTGFRVQLASFSEFEGDGLYMGAPQPNLLIHNANLQVIDCLFDGVTKGNRNAISLIDCTGWSITGTTFTRCCNPNVLPAGTPGAIDIEPELAANRVKAGAIANCSFIDIGGSAVAMLNGQGADCSGLTFTNCYISGLARSVMDIQGFDDVTASGLYADGMGFALVIRKCAGVTITNSTFRNADSILLGGLDGNVSQNVTFEYNGLYRCGNVNGPVISQNGNIDGVSVRYNQLFECGKNGAPASPLYYLNSQDPASSRVKTLYIRYNVVQPSASFVTDIGRIVGGRPVDTPATYSNVNRDPNDPMTIPGGIENLKNAP